eukprot:m.83856 g.83856  ORF g.83856 m.83856 type:complete len:631 (+) comp12941_c0_seq1:81-1973(+)
MALIILVSMIASFTQQNTSYLCPTQFIKGYQKGLEKYIPGVIDITTCQETIARRARFTFAWMVRKHMLEDGTAKGACWYYETPFSQADIVEDDEWRLCMHTSEIQSTSQPATLANSSISLEPLCNGQMVPGHPNIQEFILPGLMSARECEAIISVLVLRGRKIQAWAVGSDALKDSKVTTECWYYENWFSVEDDVNPDEEKSYCQVRSHLYAVEVEITLEEESLDRKAVNIENISSVLKKLIITSTPFTEVDVLGTTVSTSIMRLRGPSGEFLVLGEDADATVYSTISNVQTDLDYTVLFRIILSSSVSPTQLESGINALSDSMLDTRLLSSDKSVAFTVTGIDAESIASPDSYLEQDIVSQNLTSNSFAENCKDTSPICPAWVERSCLQSDIFLQELLLVNCPLTCGLCSPVIGSCIDNVTFLDANGFHCHDWLGYPCEQANEIYGYSVLAQDSLLAACPSSCMQCSTCDYKACEENDNSNTSKSTPTTSPSNDRTVSVDDTAFEESSGSDTNQSVKAAIVVLTIVLVLVLLLAGLLAYRFVRARRSQYSPTDERPLVTTPDNLENDDIGDGSGRNFTLLESAMTSINPRTMGGVPVPARRQTELVNTQTPDGINHEYLTPVVTDPAFD